MTRTRGGMSGAQRREQLLDLLSEGTSRVDELAAALHVTESTIRRDLTHLVSEGRVVRTYGGAIGNVERVTEPPLAERARQRRPAKDAIGRLAADLVRDGQTVMLDAGTTVGCLAAALRTRRDLTVITCGLTAVEELESAPGVEVYLLGGRLRRISHGTVGALAEATLRHVSADLVFLGADGLVADRGICEATLEQTHLKQLMAAAGQQVVVLADALKLGTAPFNAWAVLETPWTLVTDSSADEAQLAAFRAAGVDVRVAPVLSRQVDTV